MRDSFADAVVVAAGTSSRMGGVDKLDAPLGDRPLLAWSVEAMAAARTVRRVIVVAAADRVDRLRQLAWLRNVGASVVAGGTTRGDSVLAGIRVADAEIALVHDGARPLASAALADAVALAAAEHGAAIPVIPVSNSLKVVDRELVLGSVERAGLAAAQTPQAARRALLLDAFANAGGRAYGDEAGLLQASGVTVATVPGEVANVKVTRPADLTLVRLLASARGQSVNGRTGFGQDSHQFGRRDGLRLGGTLLADAPRLHGHSDGDVVLHSVTTALLSAAGLGDIGRTYPAGDPSTTDVSSSDLLRDVVQAVAGAGWQVTAAQVAITGARPRLGGPVLDAIRDAIAKLLEVAPATVSVTASTGNLSGAEGAGRAITAFAFVSVARA